MSRNSTRRSIQDLSRAPPEELRPLFELITDPLHPDAAVALLSAAILEHGLAEAITRELHGNVDHRALFGDRGPLGDFYGKIVMADAMGLVLPATAKDLHRVRHVRNAFAHAAAPITFDTPEVVSEVAGLTFFGHADILTFDDEGVPIPPKARFSAFVFLTCLSLTMTPAQWKDLRDGFVEFASGLLRAFSDFKGVYVAPPAID